MPRTTPRGDLIRRFILDRVDENQNDIARVTAEKFGISRQAVNRHLKSLIEQKRLDAAGNTRGRRYAEVPVTVERMHRLSPRVRESEVWRQDVLPVLRELPRNVLEICEYGFTEMFNNLLDHSEGTRSKVIVKRTSKSIELLLTDNGIGLFSKIQRGFDLAEPRDAVFELSKGKLTTDPARHSGEGVFFTSRMFDHFSACANGLRMTCQRGDNWRSEEFPPSRGTVVHLVIGTTTIAERKAVFDRFSSRDGDYTFSTTHVPVALARYGGDEDFISRSQAKRVLARVEEFREACLDFAGIETIGQAFADEMFRVFGRRHPRTKLAWVRTVPDVEKMIRRALHHDKPSNTTR